MKKIYVLIFYIAVTANAYALDIKYTGIVNTALSDLKTNTKLSLLQGHVAINISSGNKELDVQFAEALQDAYQNFSAKADSVNHEDLYQMTVKTYRENTDVYIHTTVTNFENKHIVERTAKAKSVSTAVLETLQYKTAIHAKNEFEAYLDTAFAGTGDIGLPLWEFIERGIAFLEDDKYDSALAEFNKALELKPDYAAALYFIGDVYFFQDKYDTAIEYYTRTLNIDPIPNADANYWDAYLARGICYLEKNDYDRAIADFNQSEKLRPKGAFMFYKRGLAYFNKKLYTSATKDFTKSIGLNSKNAEPYIYRGMVRILLKEYDKAVQDFSQGLKIEPTIAYVYYLRALAYSKKKYTKSAIADCEKALEIQYDLTEASELLATLRWTPPPKPPKPPKPPVKLEIDKGFHWYSAVGLVKNMESESDEYSELKYPAIGGSLMAGVSWYYLGVQSSVDFFNWFQGGFSIVGLFTLGLPLKISEFGIKPYAGIGSDVSSIVPDDSKYSSPDDFAGAVGVCFEVGIQVSIKRFFLSAAYRQRISSAEIKYRIKHSGQNYAIWEDFTKELFFNRLTVSIGVGY